MGVRKSKLDRSCAILSLTRQAELLGLQRSGLYYKSKAEDLDGYVRDALDEVYTLRPFYGSRRLAVVVSEKLNEQINRKKVQRLMRQMGIQGIGPTPSLSKPCKEHKVFPYLLRGKTACKPNEVWSTDITYIRLNHGFGFLAAVIDWFSRYVLSWRLSNTMDKVFCIETLQEALKKGTPTIFNTDQGSQFTSVDFTSILLEKGIKVSMDGRGRALDNIFVERLWRSVKYEDVYPKGYATMGAAADGLSEYFKFYNNERPHQSLNYKRPSEVHLVN